MPSYNEYDNNRAHPTPPSDRPGVPLVTDEIFGKVNKYTSLSTLIILPLMWAFKKEINVEQDDIASLCGLVTAVGSIALAIPLFFKDVDRGTLFWRHFFFIAFCFILAATLSFFCLLKFKQDDKIEITLYHFFILIITLSFQIQSFPLWIRKNEIVKSNMARIFTFDLTFSFFLSLMCMLLAVIQSTGDKLLISFLLLTIYGLYFLVINSLALIIQTLIPESSPIPVRHEIKQAIQFIVENHKDRPLSRQQLLLFLRLEAFSARQDVVNASILDQLLPEMDLETEGGPKISLFTNDKIIPRWKSDYFDQLKSADPRLIIYKSNNYDNASLSSLLEIQMKKVYEFVSESSGLSIELLTEGNRILDRYNSNEGFYAYDHDFKGYYINIVCSTEDSEMLRMCKSEMTAENMKKVEDLFFDHSFVLNGSIPIASICLYYLEWSKQIASLITEEELKSMFQLKNFDGTSLSDEVWHRLFNRMEFHSEMETMMKESIYEYLLQKTDKLVSDGYLQEETYGEKLLWKRKI